MKNFYEVLNIGVGRNISIKELATLILSIIDYEGEIIWDISKPIDLKKVIRRFKIK